MKRRGAGVARPGSARFALALVAGLAFFVQSFITQTHVHAAPVAGKATVSVAIHDGVVQKKRDPYPANEDPANCPLCQEVAHAGQYVSPAFALLVQPSERIAHVVPIPPTHATEFILSHAWRSRAPPAA